MRSLLVLTIITIFTVLSPIAANAEYDYTHLFRSVDTFGFIYASYTRCKDMSRVNKEIWSAYEDKDPGPKNPIEREHYIGWGIELGFALSEIDEQIAKTQMEIDRLHFAWDRGNIFLEIIYRENIPELISITRTAQERLFKLVLEE